MKKEIANNKGVVTTDVIIAIIILGLFTTLVATLAYNIFLQSSLAERTSQAREYAIKIFEYVDEEDFAVLNQNQIITFVSNLGDNKVSATSSNITSLTTPYKILITVADNGNTKKVTIEIRYNVGSKTRTITMQRIKPLAN